MSRKHNHYFKDVKHLNDIDVYRTLELFGVKDQALGHAIKKLLCAGGRGVKNFQRDIQEAVDTLNRRLEMFDEDSRQLDLLRDIQEPFPEIQWNETANYGSAPKDRICVLSFRSKDCGATTLLHLECDKSFESCRRFGCESRFRD